MKSTRERPSPLPREIDALWAAEWSYLNSNLSAPTNFKFENCIFFTRERERVFFDQLAVVRRGVVQGEGGEGRGGGVGRELFIGGVYWNSRGAGCQARSCAYPIIERASFDLLLNIARAPAHIRIYIHIYIPACMNSMHRTRRASWESRRIFAQGQEIRQNLSGIECRWAFYWGILYTRICMCMCIRVYIHTHTHVCVPLHDLCSWTSCEREDDSMGII